MQWPAGLDRDLARTIVEDVNVEVDVRCELLDRNLQPDGDLDGRLELDGSQVAYDLDVDVNFTCQLTLDRRLDWPAVRVRPWARLTSSSGTFEVPVGTFRLSHPTNVAGGAFRVTGYDLTSLLETAHGETIVVDVDAPYVASAVSLAAARGADLRVSAGGDSKLLPRPRWWSLETPTLQVLRELLVEGGFQEPWADPYGVLRSGLVLPFADRPVEWTYDTAHPRTTVGDAREHDARLDEVPNVMVGVTASPLSWAAVEGDGQFTIPDQPSIDRTGVTRTEVVQVEASDQEVLELRTREEFARRRRPQDEVRMQVACNPLHLHQDVVRVVDAELEVDLRGVVSSWRLPFSGDDMPLTVRAA